MVAVALENVSYRFRRQTLQASTSLKTALLDVLLHRRRPESGAAFQLIDEILAVGDEAFQRKRFD